MVIADKRSEPARTDRAKSIARRMTGFCSRTRSNPGFGADAVLVGGVGPMNQDIMRVVHDQKGTIQSTHILSLNDADASGGGGQSARCCPLIVPPRKAALALGRNSTVTEQFAVRLH